VPERLRSAAAAVGADAVDAAELLAGCAAARPGRARLLHDDAPLGVGYLVATWQADGYR
jgi:hypothetical protein